MADVTIRPGSEEGWQRYVAATKGRPPQPTLVRAASMFQAPGDALDVGAGAGRDTIHLLGLGWRVMALDSSPSAADALRAITHANLTVVVTPVEDFEPGSYDLVNAQFSLPFIPRARFDSVVQRLCDSVRPGGVMAATFFGHNDEWNTPESQLTFSTRGDVERLYHEWDLIEATEVDEDGQLAAGAPKHWHVFHVIAQRRRRQGA